MALKRLRVSSKDLAASPQITPTLKSCVKGGLKASLDAMRFASEDPEIAAFLEVYDGIPASDRERIPWEAISLAANVNPKHLLGSIQLAVAAFCATRSRFIVVSNHPDITERRVKYAKMAGGEKDRTQLDIMVGALPSAKGPTFIGKAIFGSPSSAQSGPSSTSDDDGGDTNSSEMSTSYDNLFPSVNEIQDKLVPIRQRRVDI